MVLEIEVSSDDAITLRKKNLLSRRLQPGDIFMFKEGRRSTEYFFVKRIMVRRGMIEGKYLDLSGRSDKVTMSFDEIISRNPRVAYFQEILLEQ